MGTINSTIEYFKNISTEHVIAILVALATVIVFLIFSRFISYFILKLVIPKNKQKKIKNTGLYRDLKNVLQSNNKTQKILKDLEMKLKKLESDIEYSSQKKENLYNDKLEGIIDLDIS